MTAMYRNELVRIVSICGDKAKIATKRGLRWAHIRDLVMPPGGAP
jgi:hypothetical protein